MRLHRIAVQIESLASQLLCVKLSVPRCQTDVCTFTIGNGLVVSYLRNCPCLDALPSPLEQVQRCIRIARHAIGHGEMCVTSKTEKAGQFAPQLQNFVGNGFVVERARVVTTIRPHAPDLFTQITPCGKLEERPDSAACVRNSPYAWTTFFGCDAGRGLTQVCRQSLKTRFIFDEDHLRPSLLDQVLVVMSRQSSQPRIDLGQPRLGRRRQP